MQLAQDQKVLYGQLPNSAPTAMLAIGCMRLAGAEAVCHFARLVHHAQSEEAAGSHGPPRRLAPPRRAPRRITSRSTDGSFVRVSVARVRLAVRAGDWGLNGLGAGEDNSVAIGRILVREVRRVLAAARPRS